MLQRLLYICFFIGLTFIGQAQEDSLREGNVLYRGMQFEQAIKKYNGALKDSSTIIKARYNIGNAYYQMKKYDEAIDSYKKGLALIEISDSEEDRNLKAMIYHNLGNAQVKKSEFGKAIESYKNSLRINPTDEETRYNLQYAIEKKNQQDQQDKKDPNKKDDPNEKEDPKKNDEDNNASDPKKSAQNQTKEQMKRMLDRLNKKEQEVKKKADKKQQPAGGTSNGKDW